MTLRFGHTIAWYDEGVQGGQGVAEVVDALLHLGGELCERNFGRMIAHEAPSHGKEVALQVFNIGCLRGNVGEIEACFCCGLGHEGS